MRREATRYREVASTYCFALRNGKIEIAALLNALHSHYRAEINNILSAISSCLIKNDSSEVAVAVLEKYGQEKWGTNLYNTVCAAYNRLGKYDETLSKFASLDRNQWDTASYTTVAASLNALKRYSEALDLLDSLGRENWDIMTCNVAANALCRQDRFEECIELLTDFGAQNWNQRTIRVALKAFAAGGRVPQLVSMLEKTNLKIAGTSNVGKLVADLSSQDDADGVIALLEYVDKSFWDLPIYSMAVRAMHIKNRFQEAWDLLHTLPRNKWNKYLYSCAATTLFKLGKIEEALTLLHEYGKENWDAVIHGIAARCTNKLHRSEETIQTIESLDRNSWDDDIYLSVAMALNREKRYGETITLLQDLERNRMNVSLCDSMGMALNSTGRPQQTLNVFMNVPQTEWTPVSYKIVATARTFLGHHEEAEKLWAQVLLTEPNQVYARVFIAKSLIAQQRHRQAISFLKDAIQISIPSKSILFLLAECAYNNVGRAFLKEILTMCEGILPKHILDAVSEYSRTGGVPREEFDELYADFSRSCIFKEMEIYDIRPIDRVAYRVKNNRLAPIENL